jgi:hypothetical protein
MTASTKELGHVVGWTVVLSPDDPNQERLEVDTPEAWEKAFERAGEDNGHGWPRGGQFFTRIQCADGTIDEDCGANPEALPIGTQLVCLTCKYCGKKRWSSYDHHDSQMLCICEDCNDKYDD